MKNVHHSVKTKKGAKKVENKWIAEFKKKETNSTRQKPVTALNQNLAIGPTLPVRIFNFHEVQKASRERNKSVGLTAKGRTRVKRMTWTTAEVQELKSKMRLVKNNQMTVSGAKLKSGIYARVTECVNKVTRREHPGQGDRTRESIMDKFASLQNI